MADSDSPMGTQLHRAMHAIRSQKELQVAADVEPDALTMIQAFRGSLATPRRSRWCSATSPAGRSAAVGDVLHRPPYEHHCRPGWTHIPLTGDLAHLREQGYTHQVMPNRLFNAPPGTVWRCECGRTWVARRNVPGRLYARWVPEPRFAAWRRERRERRSR